MKLDNWINKNYPDIKDELKLNFEEHYLEIYLKRLKYKVGRLTETRGDNKIGDLVLYNYTKEYCEGDSIDGWSTGYGWTGGFEYMYIFSKPNDYYNNRRYILICEEIK